MSNILNRFKNATTTSDKWVFGLMLVFGIAALIAAFNLTLDKFQVLQNPHAVLSCSINLVLNCSTVMETWQSSLFGFPNMVIGLMGFPIVITVAVAGLAGVKFPKPFLIAANIGYALAALFSFWLFFQSVYAIQVLCPWCLLVTLSMSFILSTITHYNLRNHVFSWGKRVQKFVDNGNGKLIVASWLVLLAVLVYLKFGTSLFAN